MHDAIKGIKLFTCIVVIGLLLTGCSNGGVDPDDDREGGVIGTGLILRGTATDVRVFANNTLEIKAQSGEVSKAVIDDTGRFRAPSVKGTGPHLLRVDLGNGEFRYGIAFNNERANVHSYSDVIVRNWFESNNGNLDFEFDQASISTRLPTQQQFKTTADEIFALARLVLQGNNLTGEDILSGDYDSVDNNKGIDQYLRDNPILIQQDNISVVMTDPVTKTQSVTRSGYSLFELATEPDTQSPETPESVRALASANNEVIIVWEPAFDNRGVVAYDIFRDGDLIATTPYPVFVDTGLDANRVYSYEISATDASDNTSATSVAVTNSTLSEPDSIAPPAPVQLMVNASLGRMDLLWGQNNIGDVVQFEVYRGRNNNPNEILQTVTSSVMTDITVSSGVNYCYQVSAIDASGNTSERSEEVCELAAGEEVQTLNDQPLEKVPALAGLTIPDIEELNCNATWTELDIQGFTRTEPLCYLVNNSITVSNGGRFSISAGTVFKFAAGTGLVVTAGGSLSVEGTKSSPVVLSAQDPTPGFWSGIVYEASNSSRNILVNTVVEYAGGGIHNAAVALNAVEGQLARVEITGSVIRDCVGVGVRASNELDNLSRLDGSIITGCDMPLSAHVHGLAGVTQRNDFAGNRVDLINLGNAQVNSDLEIKKLDVPYVLDELIVDSGRLTILEEVELQFRSGGALRVRSSLSTRESATRRVKLTGTVQEPGHWMGVVGVGQVALRSVDIDYAGYVQNEPKFSGGLLLALDGQVSLSDVRFNNGSSYAINVRGANSNLTSINNVSMQNNAQSIRIPIDKINQLGTEPLTSSNFDNTIDVYAGIESSGSTAMRNLGLPYTLLDSLNWINGSLSLYPGVNVYMGNDVGINIGQGSIFSSQGTLDEPITLTHRSQIPGSWSGIKIASNSSANRIAHTTIAFAGAMNSSVSSAVTLNCPDGSLAIENTKIEDSYGWGIATEGTGQCNLTVGDDVQFNRNRLGGIEN